MDKKTIFFTSLFALAAIVSGNAQFVLPAKNQKTSMLEQSGKGKVTDEKLIKIVREIYQSHREIDFSRAFLNVIAKVRKADQNEDMGYLDHDILTQAQDDVSVVKVIVVSNQPGKASVKVVTSFEQVLNVALVLEDGLWKVDNVNGEREKMNKYLKEVTSNNFDNPRDDVPFEPEVYTTIFQTGPADPNEDFSKRITKDPDFDDDFGICPFITSIYVDFFKMDDVQLAKKYGTEAFYKEISHYIEGVKNQSMIYYCPWTKMAPSDPIKDIYVLITFGGFGSTGKQGSASVSITEKGCKVDLSIELEDTADGFKVCAINEE